MRNKLTYLFIGLVALLILILSLSIYFFSADFREEEFYRRLETKATSTARLLSDDVKWQARNELMKRNPGYTIQVAFQDTAEDENALIIKGNEQLVKTAIVNLMDNGCKYSSKHLVHYQISYCLVFNPFLISF